MSSEVGEKGHESNPVNDDLLGWPFQARLIPFQTQKGTNMSKRLFLLLGVCLLGGLVACQSQTPEATQPKPTPMPTLAPTATKAVLPPKPAATASPVPEDTSAPTATPSPVPEVAGVKASPTPTRPWQIPEVQPDDWTKGGGDAGLTLVEYGDFQ